MHRVAMNRVAVLHTYKIYFTIEIVYLKIRRFQHISHKVGC